ncbi:uncharacterized protein UV8b_02742 [Ustilaginoidea virens]|uniref:F-box domain-containing protein n=1 Tax=Ustilaginoidea virens TaxID=1159556 RepID=A0A8E5MGD9_USTVR|nr:uncharacterized protein UV8b_02742 [Ustilaginoidea virens]QUC18501.1 hypothetical protein UV8b_02742 [Ustilaginoidea virens]
MRLPFRKKRQEREGLASPVFDEFRAVGGYGLKPLLFPPSRFSAQLLASLPPRVLERIFVFVCPHAVDDSYETCEKSANEKGCMLCDLRDLSRCVQVNRAWRATAIKILYHSVRIDPVHYCQLEAFLAERRKRTSRFDRNGTPEDPALARLRLLRRTVRDDPTRIGKTVRFLKTPYMIRESCHVELAQTIAVLPNLKYVDLPEGMFSDEPSYTTLRLEVQARCSNIRKTTYAGGSERSFASLMSGQIWPCLEVLELKRLNVDPKVLRGVLTCLGNLRALKVAETYSLSDEVLLADESLPPLPALEELVLKDTPSLTSAGLIDYLSFYETQNALKVLTLKDTGIQPWKLQDVLAMAPSLKTLVMQSEISDSFPTGEAIPPLKHTGLTTLRFEISSTSAAGPFATQAYHAYLANSILTGNLPRLRRLYVLDEQFPDQLRNLPPPTPTFAGGRVRTGYSASASAYDPPSPRVTAPGSGLLSPTSPTRQHMPSLLNPHRLSSNNPFANMKSGAGLWPVLPPTQTLEVFTKDDEHGKWNFAQVDSLTDPATAPSHRWSSSYGLAADVTGQGWDRGEARRSIMIGDGTGAFLPLDGAEDGPRRSEVFALGPVPVRGGMKPRSSSRDGKVLGIWSKV